MIRGVKKSRPFRREQPREPRKNPRLVSWAGGLYETSRDFYAVPGAGLAPPPIYSQRGRGPANGGKSIRKTVGNNRSLFLVPGVGVAPPLMFNVELRSTINEGGVPPEAGNPRENDRHEPVVFYGARGRTRTDKAFRPGDFKSPADTSFATRAELTAVVRCHERPLSL